MNYKLHTIKKIKETYAILNCIVGAPVLKELQLNNTRRQIARERETQRRILTITHLSLHFVIQKLFFEVVQSIVSTVIVQIQWVENIPEIMQEIHWHVIISA